MKPSKTDICNAALAAGYTLREIGNQVCVHADKISNLPWEPWADNDQAFDLMVDAGISVVSVQASKRTSAFTDIRDDSHSLWDDFDGDQHAATRYAIFKAAALKGSKLVLT